MNQTQNKQMTAGPASAPKSFVNEKQLAGMLDVKVKTLQRWRLFGKGPRFRKFGSAVRYAVADVEAWIANCPTGGGEQREAA